MTKAMKICVVGTGYVGLVAGACFADTGNEVVCVDQDASKIEKLRRAVIPIYEPGLQEVVHRGIQEKRLSFTLRLEEGVTDADIIFLAVGTPSRPDGKPDLQYLEMAARNLGKHMKSGAIVINKSTVPIGAHAKVREWIASGTKVPFEVASNPEFLKEGSAVDDFIRPDRVVIGTESEEVFRKMEKLYAPFVRQGNPILWMDPVSAEMTKYACNSFLAARISFMNELSRLCDEVDADIEKIRKGMATDARIGKHFLFAGVGYGGSCFPKDIRALLSTAQEHAVELGVIAAVEKANETQKSYFVDKIVRGFGGSLEGKTLCVLGIAFKPNTDDLREAPALAIIDGLLASGAKIRAFDPVAMPNAEAVLGKKVELCKNAMEAIQGSDAIVIVTEWNEFRQLPLEKVKKIVREARIFDGRNIVDPEAALALGFKYFSVGRAPFETR